MRKLTSIIIPTFNERQNILKLIPKIEKVARKNNLKIEIIVVDDDSPDKTGYLAKNFFFENKTVRVFIRKKGRGLGTAILFGIKRSRGGVIVGMDADFNHPPEKIPELIGGLKKADLVVASRFIKGGGTEDKLRYIFTFLFNVFLRRFLGFPTMDNLSGFYCIKKEKLFTLSLDEIYNGYGEYHLRLVYLANLNNFKIKEIPVFYPSRSYGKSKSNLRKLFFIYFKEAFLLRFGNTDRW